ncbi:unnamed protein product [Dovyalis caffra]|uniref:Thioredoxin domain-containing protein n=1 Tax=Dovyalis caffra TaxID=77055 RepID=A0AAV1QXH6_9ROSI|nr:unnamed protein product [Dovyalis caffra]
MSTTSTLLFLSTVFWFTLLNEDGAKARSLLEDKPNLYEAIFTTNQDFESPKNFDDKNPRKPLLFDEKDVVVLGDKNFSDFVNKNRHVMVQFYATWCYWSLKLAPEYSAAATLLKGEAVLAKVEATEEKELVSKYQIQGYPTVHLFVDGILKDSYYGERTRDAIATWMRQKTGLVVQTVSTTEGAQGILSTNSVIVMRFLDTSKGPDTKELAAASKLQVDVNFYQIDNVDVARFLGVDPQIKRPALIMLRREVVKHIHSGFDDEITRSAISDFASVNKHPLVITFTEKYSSHIFKNSMKQLWLFAPKNSLKLISTFAKAAKAFREKLLFVYVETDDLDAGLGANLAYRFELPEGSLRIVAYMANRVKYQYHDELTFGGIKSFAEEFLEDKISFPSVPSSKTVRKLPSDSQNSNLSFIANA